jgi:anti-sigma B factor antagonist
MSSLNIKDRQAGNVIVLDIEGDLRIGGNSTALRKAVRRLLQEGQKQILLNLAHVAFIDSSGLGELIASRLLMDEDGGQIKLLHLTPRVRELLTITELLTVFDVYEDEAKALASFESYVLNLTEPQPAKLEGRTP